MKHEYTVRQAGALCEVTLESLGSDRFRFSIADRIVELVAREVGPGQYLMLDGQRVHDLTVVGEPPALRVVGRDGQVEVDVLDERELARQERASRGPERSGSEIVIRAPMPGKIVQLLGAVGDDIAEGQAVLVMEAMKMENELRSPAAGRVRQYLVEAGQSVEAGQRLALIA